MDRDKHTSLHFTNPFDLYFTLFPLWSKLVYAAVWIRMYIVYPYIWYVSIYTVVLMKFRTSYKNEKKVPKKGKTAKQITRRIQQRFTWNIAHKNRLKKFYMKISSFIDYHEFLESRKFPKILIVCLSLSWEKWYKCGNFRHSRNSWLSINEDISMYNVSKRFLWAIFHVNRCCIRRVICFAVLTLFFCSYIELRNFVRTTVYIYNIYIYICDYTIIKFDG